MSARAYEGALQSAATKALSMLLLAVAVAAVGVMGLSPAYRTLWTFSVLVLGALAGPVTLLLMNILNDWQCPILFRKRLTNPICG